MRTDPVSRLRRFNRAVTAEVGALDQSFLGRGRPLGVARVLNAIGRGCGDVAAIRAYLGLDSGLTSRILRTLEEEGLVITNADPADARRRIASLTAAGAAEYAEYEALSEAQAETILARHPDPERLLAAMDLVAGALNRDRIAIVSSDPEAPAAQWCLSQYYAELNRRFAGGFDVTLSADPEAEAMRDPRGTFLLADSDGVPVGCAGLKGTDKGYAEIKRLWIAPEVRGQGLARRMMAALEEEARGLGIALLRLDTNSALPEAAALYRRLGWTEIDRFNEDPYPDLFFERRL